MQSHAEDAGSLHVEITLVLLAKFAVSLNQGGLYRPGAHVRHSVPVDGDTGQAQLMDAATSDFTRSTAENESELFRIQPRVLNCQRSVFSIQFPLVVLRLAMFVKTKFGYCQMLHAVAVEEDPDNVLHGRLVADQEALVLALGHEDAVVDPDQAALLHLQRELALAPRVARGQFSRSSVLIQNQGSCHCFTDHNFHAEIK